MNTIQILMMIAVLVLADFMTGYVKAYTKCELNSSIGLDGLIRKAMILFSMLIFMILDGILRLNFISCLPNQILEVIQRFGIEKIGLSELMGMGIILQEGTSILENLHQLGVPIPKFIAQRIEKIRQSYLTEEEGDV